MLSATECGYGPTGPGRTVSPPQQGFRITLGKTPDGRPRLFWRGQDRRTRSGRRGPASVYGLRASERIDRAFSGCGSAPLIYAMWKAGLEVRDAVVAHMPCSVGGKHHSNTNRTSRPAGTQRSRGRLANSVCRRPRSGDGVRQPPAPWPVQAGRGVFIRGCRSGRQAAGRVRTCRARRDRCRGVDADPLALVRVRGLNGRAAELTGVGRPDVLNHRGVQGTHPVVERRQVLTRSGGDEPVGRVPQVGRELDFGRVAADAGRRTWGGPGHHARSQGGRSVPLGRRRQAAEMAG